MDTRKQRKRKYDHLLDNMILLFNQKYNCHEIGRLLSIDHRIVWKYLKKMGLTSSRSDSNRIYEINEHAFDVIDNDAAYWLGCLWGDGSLHSYTSGNGGTIHLHGHIQDVEHAEKFRKFLSSNHPIRPLKKKKGYVFAFSAIRLYNRLTELGLYQNKCHTIKYPSWLTMEQHSHFVRGLFDTDGTVGFRLRKRYKTKQGTFSITMNQYIIDSIDINIKHLLDLNPTVKSKSKKNIESNTWKISYEGRNKLLKIRDWIYSNANVFLHRKHQVFYNNLN